MNLSPTILLALLAAFVVSCGSNKREPSPTGVLVPKEQKAADPTPVSDGIKEVDRKLDKAQDTAKRLENQLARAEEKVRDASRKADSAFRDGLIAGSTEAKELSEAVSLIESELEKTRADRVSLSEELESTASELESTSVALDVLKVDLTKTQAETELLRSSLAEANWRISLSSQIAEDLKDKNAILRGQIVSSKKWTRRWATWLVILALMNAVYIAGRVNGWGWIR
jgi:chromosome segregation ATPase